MALRMVSSFRMEATGGGFAYSVHLRGKASAYQRGSPDHRMGIYLTASNIFKLPSAAGMTALPLTECRNS